MIEKLAASFAAVLAIVLGVWARMTFVRRSEIYGKDGKPVYRHATDCIHAQEKCNSLVCLKIEEVKKNQTSAAEQRHAALAGIHDELKTIRQFIGTVEQYIKDH